MRLLSQMHKDKRKVWARDNMKTDFSEVVFTDISRIMFGWAWRLVDKEKHKSSRDDDKVAASWYVLQFIVVRLLNPMEYEFLENLA